MSPCFVLEDSKGPKVKFHGYTLNLGFHEFHLDQVNVDMTSPKVAAAVNAEESSTSASGEAVKPEENCPGASGAVNNPEVK